MLSETMNITGYGHSSYARALVEFGTSLYLPCSEGTILKRSISGFPYSDAMGCYPIFACQDWSRLGVDLEMLSRELVSLSVVTDPFGQYDENLLQDCFKDVVKPFKEHFVVDLSLPKDSYVHPHHQRNARKALDKIAVERCESPITHLDEWISLYQVLIERHQIKGLTAFSPQSFAKQLTVPGIEAFHAIYDGAIIGMLLWYVQGNIAYYHLGAYNPIGYELRASFALFSYAIDYFSKNQLDWLSLGAGAGVDSNGMDGLTRYKQGWSTGTRTAYFCGRIFNPKLYQEIVSTKGIPPTNFFPAYRAGEF